MVHPPAHAPVPAGRGHLVVHADLCVFSLVCFCAFYGCVDRWPVHCPPALLATKLTVRVTVPTQPRLHLPQSPDTHTHTPPHHPNPHQPHPNHRYNRRGLNDRMYCKSCGVHIASHLGKGTKKEFFGCFPASIAYA